MKRWFLAVGWCLVTVSTAAGLAAFGERAVRSEIMVEGLLWLILSQVWGKQ